MIQANELRIGNWIGIPECAIVAQVDIIGEKKVCINVNPVDLDRNQNDFELVSLEGILLFKKMLISIGFNYEEVNEDPENEKSWYEYTLESKNGYLHLMFDGEWYYMLYTKGSLKIPDMEYRGYVKIKYVHQLQNLYFTLNGTELEINLK